MIEEIQNCFKLEKVLFSRHAKTEMDNDEFGIIIEQDVVEVILNGEIIEDYPDDEPYPSCLIYGKTERYRPLHVVCAYSKENDLTIIVTVYHPEPEKWVNNKRRKE
jgi:hypothetical protein